MQNRTLTRSTDKVLFGICGGLARHFGWDPVLLRVMFVLVALFGGPTPVVYLVLYFLMPKPGTAAPVDGPPAPA